MSYSIGTIIKQHQPESLAPLFLSLSFAVVNFSPVLYLYMNIQWYLPWGEGDVLELKLNTGTGKEQTGRNLGELSFMCLASFWILVWIQYVT